MLKKYILEEQNRSINLHSISKSAEDQAEKIKSQIESRFFNISDGLDTQTQKILNAKIAQIRDHFIGQINIINYNADCLQQKVTLMEKMNKDGVKFRDLDAEQLIFRLSQVEEVKCEQNIKLCEIDSAAKHRADIFRPRLIWDLLAKYFGPEYFLEVVEEEYGISPERDAKLTENI